MRSALGLERDSSTTTPIITSTAVGVIEPNEDVEMAIAEESDQANYTYFTNISGGLETLRNFNARKLYKALDSLSDEQFETWFTNMGLLPFNRTCECGGLMRVREREGGRGRTWRCSKKTSGKVCNKEMGYMTGSFFEGSHLSLKEVFQLSYYFARNTHTQEEVQFDMRREDGSTVARQTVVDFKNFFREVCEAYFSRHPVIIGGPGKVVEIDETVITKRKYHRGQLRAEEQWFFGGVERGSSDRCFLVPVERRDAATLLPIIARHVLQGSTIISGMYGAKRGMLVRNSGSEELGEASLDAEPATSAP